MSLDGDKDDGTHTGAVMKSDGGVTSTDTAGWDADMAKLESES